MIAGRSSTVLAEIALLLMAVIWGVNYSVIKYGTTVVPPLAVNGESAQGGSLAGDLLVLCGSVCWAVYTVFLVPYTTRVSGWWVTALTVLGGSCVLIVIGAHDLLAVNWIHLPSSAWTAIAYS